MARSKFTKSKERKMSKDQVYFDPRRAGEQQVEDIKAAVDAAMKKDEEEQEKINNIETGKAIVAGLGTLLISPLVLMFVWNLCIPALFGLPVLTYWSGMGLIIISRLLFQKYD